MTSLYLPEDGAHFYTTDGIPMHQVPNESRPGEYRNTNISDARKLGLYKSVSVVLRMIHKPALEAYKINQHLLAAMTLPRIEDESSDAFIKRVLADAKRHGEEAAEFGTRVHEHVEWELSQRAGYTKSQPVYHMNDYPVMEQVTDWLGKHAVDVEALEKSVASEELRVGGRLDIIGAIPDYRIPLSVIDIKTQAVLGHQRVKSKPWPYFNHYKEHKFQTAGYSMLDKRGLPTAVIYIASDVPGFIEVVRYNTGDGVLGFLAARSLWEEVYWNNDDGEVMLAEGDVTQEL